MNEQGTIKDVSPSQKVVNIISEFSPGEQRKILLEATELINQRFESQLKELHVRGQEIEAQWNEFKGNIPKGDKHYPIHEL